jgi:hypothetical protein
MVWGGLVGWLGEFLSIMSRSARIIR